MEHIGNLMEHDRNFMEHDENFREHNGNFMEHDGNFMKHGENFITDLKLHKTCCKQPSRHNKPLWLPLVFLLRPSLRAC